MTAANRAIKIEHGPKSLLPYDYNALELVIDTKTMMLHHDHYHASYLAKLNSALEEIPDLQGRRCQILARFCNRSPLLPVGGCR